MSVAENFRRAPFTGGQALIDGEGNGTPRLISEETRGGEAFDDAVEHMKETASCRSTPAVHEADLMRLIWRVRFRLGRPGCPRVATRAVGWTGWLLGGICNLPDTIEQTGHDAVYANIAFDKRRAVGMGTTITPSRMHKEERVVYGSTDAHTPPPPPPFESATGDRIKLHLDDGNDRR